MTTALGARPDPASPPAPHGALHRRPDRRRRSIEKIVAAALLLTAFAITVVLLGLQWLGNQGSATSAPLGTSHTPYTVTSEVRSL